MEKQLPNVLDEQAYREKVQVFKDRFHAGELLAKKLDKYTDTMNVLLLAIPAGGVPVGYQIAQILHVALDIIVVRKIQIPWNSEAGFGAVTWDGETVLNMPLVQQLSLSKEEIDEAIATTKQIVNERLAKFRGDTPLPDVKNKIVIVTDDGLASGYTMLVTVQSIRNQNPKAILIVVPTASRRAVELVAPKVDELVCLNIRSSPIFAVADAYLNWYDLSDEEVIELLK